MTLERASGYTFWRSSRPRGYERAEEGAIERSGAWLRRSAFWTAPTIRGRPPYGAQRRLEIARCHVHARRSCCASMSRAALILAKSGALNDLLRRGSAKTMRCRSLIEHDGCVIGISDRVWCRPAQDRGGRAGFRSDPKVIPAYSASRTTSRRGGGRAIGPLLSRGVKPITQCSRSRRREFQMSMRAISSR